MYWARDLDGIGMGISHLRISRLEEKVGISPRHMFIFSAPCPYHYSSPAGSRGGHHVIHGGAETKFTDDDFFRLVGRERRPEDLVVVLAKFYDPADPDSKAAMGFGSPISEVALISSKDLGRE